MIFTKTNVEGAYIVRPEKHTDARGFFARIWCQDEFSKHGLKTNLLQANVSRSTQRGTLRGMHYQMAPYAETKLVRCTKGAVYDVIVDIRRDSPTFKKWFGIELTEDNHTSVYVPEGFAHGFLTLTDDAEVTYLVTAFYNAEHERGIRYNDKAFGIKWPEDIVHISEKDDSHSDFEKQKT